MVGPRASFFLSFSIATIGSIFYIIFSTTATSLVPLMVLSTKFGIAGAFSCVWIANTLFPPLYASTTIGFFNAFARLSSMLAPQIAELSGSAPMIVFCIVSGLAGVASLFLKVQTAKLVPSSMKK